MYEKSFLKRVFSFGIKHFILSWDTFIFIIVFFSVFIVTKGTVVQETANNMLEIFMNISASLFAIVLAGLAIVTSFTDKEFIYLWKKIGKFDDMITLFQFNLYVPLLILICSLILRFIFYNSIIMIILISLFAYMIMSLMDLISFISKYGLQRGEFVKQYKEISKSTKKKTV
jgi:hypothetical protein